MERKIIIYQIYALLAQLAQLDDPYSSSDPMPTMPAKPPTKDEYLTIREAAERYTGISEHTIRRLALDGKIHYVRAGAGKNGKILISRNSLEAYLEGGDA